MTHRVPKGWWWSSIAGVAACCTQIQNSRTRTHRVLVAYSNWWQQRTRDINLLNLWVAILGLMTVSKTDIMAKERKLVSFYLSSFSKKMERSPVCKLDFQPNKINREEGLRCTSVHRLSHWARRKEEMKQRFAEIPYCLMNVLSHIVLETHIAFFFMFTTRVFQ